MARFCELAALALSADRREVYGHPSCVLRGNMFMGLYEGSLILRPAEPDRTEFLRRYGGGLFEPLPDRPVKEFVVVPSALIGTREIEDWVRRSLAYTEQLPPRGGRKS